MNAKPHTHELQVINQGCEVVIRYGDQSVRLHEHFGHVRAKRLKKACQRLIKRHDKASLAAGQRLEDIGDVLNMYEDLTKTERVIKVDPYDPLRRYKVDTVVDKGVWASQVKR